MSRSILLPLSGLSPAHQAEALAQLNRGKPTPAGGVIPQSPVSTGRKRIRQNAAGLNATEQRFFDWLRANYPFADIGSQRVRFKLANGAWYKPDNDAWELIAGRLVCYEVKGYMRPKDALTIKVAAKEFPRVLFVLVTENPGGGWDMQEILP
jgi:hypothetical protein